MLESILISETPCFNQIIYHQDLDSSAALHHLFLSLYPPVFNSNNRCVILTNEIS